MEKARFLLEQLVATPGVLTALEKAGQNALEFLSRHQHSIGATSPMRISRRTSSRSSTIFGFCPPIHSPRVSASGSSPRLTECARSGVITPWEEAHQGQ